MAHQVFIDGEAGTTGLQIRERLAARSDIEVLLLGEALRKDLAAREEALNEADAVILCLPDEAAKEAVSLVRNPKVKVIDASSAHRVAEGWTYGFPELRAGQREAIAGATRISNPGCYPTGFLGLMAPLVRAGLVPPEFPITVNAVSGYSGGGKGLIAEFEEKGATDAARPYGYTMKHKHVPEMTRYAGLAHAPLFAPMVGRYAQGMLVEVPLQLWALPRAPKVAALREALQGAYAGERFVGVADEAETLRLQTARAGAADHVPALDPEALNGTNRLQLYMFGDDAAGQARLVAVLDNLGKGASGAAVQNLNLALGLDEAAGLI
jgi:N-acetyl-gamma-glutamyl-phosphate reductase